MRRREQVLAGVVLLLVSAVGLQTYSDAKALNALDRTSMVEPQGLNMLALATGTLGGDESTGCPWLEHEGARLPVVLEHPTAGVDFAVSPPAVETLGGVLVRFGETLALSGGHDSDATVPECASLGAPFRASSISRR
jgi:hypothetical protein